MSKGLSNRVCLLKLLPVVGVLGVSSLIPLPALGQINLPLNPYTLPNSTIITPNSLGGVGTYLQRIDIPGGTVTSYFGAYNSGGTFVITPDRVTIGFNGWISYPNGVVISPYGWVGHPNGTSISPNGWVSNLNGTVVSPGGEVITLGQ